MVNVFEITDKTGRKIRLTNERWKHIAKWHPYMVKYLEEIKETIQKPDKIVSFLSTKKAYYYKSYKYLPSPNRYVLTIIKYLNGEGFVITSYLEDKIK